MGVHFLGPGELNDEFAVANTKEALANTSERPWNGIEPDHFFSN